MTKPALLFLAHRIPFPPNKGDKIRSFNLLRCLAEDYRVYLGAFVDDPTDWQYESRLSEYCSEVFLTGIKPWHKVWAFSGLLRRQPLTLPLYRYIAMQSWVSRVIAQQDITRAMVFSSAMAQYLSGERYSRIHRLIDFVDVDSEKWREYSHRRNWPASWIYGREAELLLKYDKAIAQEFDANIFVSEQEAELFKGIAPEVTRPPTFIGNGVDTDYFSPDIELVSPYPAEAKALVFTGAMDYWANVDAVTWFVTQVWPGIKNSQPDALFYIVGGKPDDAVLKLQKTQGVHVTGAVKDIRPYLKYAVAAIAPMRIARGIQNKVLEAMAMAKPVVATSAAIEGIPVTNSGNIADEPKSFEDACIVLLNQNENLPERSGNRELVQKHFNWGANLRKLERMLGDNPDLKETHEDSPTPDSLNCPSGVSL